MKILHLSDFHAGSKGVISETPYPLIGSDFIFKTKQFINSEVDHPDLVIFTGDLVSVGNTSDLGDPEIYNFFEPFIKKKIPILICNGNHDLELDKVNQGWQFIDYTSFIQKHKRKFKIRVSTHFDQNQASFIDFPKWNILFLSLNSSPNIVQDSNIVLKNASLGIEKTSKFLDEVKKKIKIEFHQRNIFIIIHHPLEELIKHNNSAKFLEENNIRIIFAGDSHKFSMFSYKNHLGITAGSIFGSQEARTDTLNKIIHPNQFILYTLNPIDKTLTIQQYKNDSETGDWIIGEIKSKEITFCRKWTVEDFSIHIKCEIAKFENQLFKFIYEDLSYEADYIGYDNFGEKTLIYHVKKEDQNKANIIQNVYKNYILKKQRKEKLLIIDNTGKLKCQIPNQYIIEVIL